MWCRLQTIIIPMILFGLSVPSVEGLGFSSFGKANTDPPEPPKPTAPPAPPCSRQAQCAGISGTSCVRTHYDATTRCLCGDNLPPVNGQCDGTQNKNLYHACSNSDECNDGLICGAPNITNNAPYLRVYQPTDKICLCDAENGYREREHTCSDADILKTSIFAIVVVACIRKFLVY
ncbi:uncharacterized protein LOC113234521 isoform X2 [Hyposmocoma kahamanoa]|uniref:uncharacterized protein LOC113234521 isoform X2 n=1 Tax=Hyposmocoma kahamanoa TaxID=1477025 RepID=UPI000E6D997C|nr:uncharacterized protein LOC113234521 isoform X2 [Hyposmocoma kahamanoa]XP_026325650.1 uncharacterized protein LOC113234521 isoform X2 [Hyposmocoma kahamanoa]XP_026325651.1 uncharacterized protein LOC113234521 isoform X2 [Hyposmocoma kahamanoa]